MYGEKLFEIGNFGPTLYGIMFAVGILCCLAILNILGKKVGLTKKSIDFFELMGIVAILVGVLTSMIFQWIYDLIKYGTASFGSMTFIGGLIGGAVSFMLGTFFFAKPDVKKQFLKLAQVAMPCILVAHAFGRVGCFFAGCCYGEQTSSWIGMEFPYGNSHGHVIPTQLIEAIFLFILCAITIIMALKEKPFNIVIYALSYSIFRFVIEFFRDDDRGGFMPGLTPSQFWCVIIFAVGLFVLALQLLAKFKRKVLPKKLLALADGLNNSAIINMPVSDPVEKAIEVKAVSENITENSEIKPEVKKIKPKGPPKTGTADKFDD